MTKTLPLALALVLAACASPDDSGTAPDADSTSVPATDSRGPSPEASGVLPSALGAPDDLDLRPSAEGLVFENAATGETYTLAFGSPTADAVSTAGAVLGAEPETSASDECGAGPLEFASWPVGFQVLSQEGEFRGWALSESQTGATPPATRNGLNVGLVRSELDERGGLTVEETSLGTEFAVGGVYGVLNGDEPGSVVTNVWSGVSCTAR